MFIFLLWVCANLFYRNFFSQSAGLGIGAIFFNVLLTMEIIETVKVFAKDHQNKLRIILLVGLIAVTRKILLLDAMHAEPMMEIATAVLVVALSLGYYLISRSGGRREVDTQQI
ncbi:phosphate-starvation-inducible PsiE family protein [Niabella ginsengisoli]|uniref:Phosphate-starvation-inducible PsiE family protein n=1 Tax=Niabella ginsengisoli TaxID=522298 RepID=A0ABS9SLQ4_9BACT|nr:phosphate-starvation-inducible PsiE family protein [Niabella ginsengisoli]MCH5599311.1 phosphate-starvation-inducible PsiE family protein [Niabella ginsengisoli]